MSSEELPEVFDPSQYEGTEFVPIPPGWQSAQIVEASRKEALNNSASTYVLAVFEILEGAHKGRKIFQNVTLTNANQQAVEIGTRLLKDICRVGQDRAAQEPRGAAVQAGEGASRHQTGQRRHLPRPQSGHPGAAV